MCGSSGNQFTTRTPVLRRKRRIELVVYSSPFSTITKSKSARFTIPCSVAAAWRAATAGNKRRTQPGVGLRFDVCRVEVAQCLHSQVAGHGVPTTEHSR